jgi:hypothetical protein
VDVVNGVWNIHKALILYPLIPVNGEGEALEKSIGATNVDGGGLRGDLSRQVRQQSARALWTLA